MPGNKRVIVFNTVFVRAVIIFCSFVGFAAGRHRKAQADQKKEGAKPLYQSVLIARKNPSVCGMDRVLHFCPPDNAKHNQLADGKATTGMLDCKFNSPFEGRAVQV